MKTQAAGIPTGIGRDSRMTYAFFFSIFLEFAVINIYVISFLHEFTCP